MEVANSPSVGGAEPANGPAIFVCYLEELEGFWSLVAPVLGDLGLGEEEDSFISVSNFLMALYCFEVVAVRCMLALVIWKSVRLLLVAASAIHLR